MTSLCVDRIASVFGQYPASRCQVLKEAEETIKCKWLKVLKDWVLGINDTNWLVLWNRWYSFTSLESLFFRFIKKIWWESTCSIHSFSLQYVVCSQLWCIRHDSREHIIMKEWCIRNTVSHWTKTQLTDVWFRHITGLSWSHPVCPSPLTYLNDVTNV